jgi:hypothetical protein
VRFEAVNFGKVVSNGCGRDARGPSKSVDLETYTNS